MYCGIHLRQNAVPPPLAFLLPLSMAEPTFYTWRSAIAGSLVALLTTVGTIHFRGCSSNPDPRVASVTLVKVTASYKDCRNGWVRLPSHTFPIPSPCYSSKHARNDALTLHAHPGHTKLLSPALSLTLSKQCNLPTLNSSSQILVLCFFTSFLGVNIEYSLVS